jgi:prophage regulatory protein
MQTSQQATDSLSTAERLVRLPEVRFLTGLGKSSIYDAVKAGTFPQAVRVTEYAVAWRKSEIDAWIAQRPSAAEPVAPPPVAKARADVAPARTKSRATATRKAPHRAAAPAVTKRGATTARKARA